MQLNQLTDNFNKMSDNLQNEGNKLSDISNNINNGGDKLNDMADKLNGSSSGFPTWAVVVIVLGVGGVAGGLVYKHKK